MRTNRKVVVLLLLAGAVQAQYIRPAMRSRDRIGLQRREEAEAGGPVAGGDSGGPEASEESDTSDSGSSVNAAATSGASGDTGEDGGGGGNNKNLYLISHDDFCVYGPREAGTPIASTGQDVVSWCTTGDHGSQVIPQGTLNGATYVKTPNYVQVSGTGDFTKLNLPADDPGGQLDSSKHTPEGAQLFLADNQPASSWVTIIGADTFCVRACTGDPQYCPTQYDEMGCWFFTNGGVGWNDVFQDCEGEDGDVPGVQDGKTYTQGETPVPTPKIPAVSNCQAGTGAPGGGPAASGASNHSSGAGSSDSATSGASGSASGSSSGSMIPMETCMPCAGGGGTSSSGSGSGPASPTSGGAAVSSGTIQVGMGPMTSSGASLSGAGGASATTSAAAGGGGDQLQARQQNGQLSVSSSASTPGITESSNGHDGKLGGADAEDLSQMVASSSHASESGAGAGAGSGSAGPVVTKGDQCCFTTWTPAGGAAGGAGPTGAPGASSGSSKSSGTQHPYMNMSGTATASGGISATGGVAGGNNSGNGTGSDSGAMAAIDVHRPASGAVVLLVALMIVGGWTLS